MAERDLVSDEAWAVIGPAFPVWKGNGRPAAARPGSLPRSTRAAPDVERCFNNLKRWRGIATRTDTTARNFPAAILLAAAPNWLGASVSNAL